uniref:synapsin-1-like n=1 Tax=Callithrix jacchus TaxID=9483 RepID=UPI00159E4BD0|nr:synapsin-1-like [Callithrix jacchus]
MPGWGWLTRPGVPVLGEVICTLNHLLRALPTGLQTRPLRAHLLSHPGLSGRSPARPGKTPSGIPSAGTPTGAQRLRLDKKGTGPRSFPDPGETEKGKDWGSLEEHWIPRTHPSPGPLRPLPRRRKLQRRQRLGGAEGLGLLPSRPQVESSPSPTFSSRWDAARAAPAPARRQAEQARRAPGCGPATCRTLPSSTLPLSPPTPHLPPQPPLGAPLPTLPARAPRGVCSPASPPLVPAGARGIADPRSLLDRAAPALPGFLFNNINREAPEESAQQNFLPDWGWAEVARDNPRCPGFLSPLGPAGA